MDSRDGARPDPSDRLLHLVDQGLHITGITGIAHGQMQGKDEARRWLGDNPRFAAELGGAVAFARADGRNGGIVRVDNLTVGQGLALRQSAGLVCDPVMRLQSGRKLGVQTRLLGLRQRAPGQPAPGARPVPDLQQLRLGLAHQRHKHVSHPPTLAAEAAHHLRQVVLELLRLRLQRRALGGALRSYGRDDLEDFFWALYRVAASLTRWLPCSLGKVSTTRCAGLTKPSSIAVAAWIASNSCHQRLVEPTAKLGEHFRQHKMLLGACNFQNYVGSWAFLVMCGHPPPRLSSSGIL